MRVYDQKRRYLPNSLHLCAWISVQLYASHLALSCVKQELASFYNKLWLTAIAWIAKHVYVLPVAMFKDPEPQRLAQASAAERALGIWSPEGHGTRSRRAQGATGREAQERGAAVGNTQRCGNAAVTKLQRP